MIKLPCYNEKTNVLFIHIPKNASLSISNGLDIDIKKHYPYFILEQMIPKDIIENSIKVACVRNPWERMASMLKYHQKKGYYPENYNLRTFINNGKQRWNMSNFDFMSQFRWCYSLETDTMNEIQEKNPNDTWMDFIFNYDRLDKDWNEFRDLFRLDIPDLGITHSSGEYSYKEEYQSSEHQYAFALISNVQTLFADDIYFMKWEFGKKHTQKLIW